MYTALLALFPVSICLSAFAEDGWISTIANTNSAVAKLYFDTGYYVKAGTRVELDCAMATDWKSAAWIFGGSSSTSERRFLIAFNSANTIMCRLGSGSDNGRDCTMVNDGVDHRLERNTYILDNVNRVASVVTGGVTNWISSVFPASVEPVTEKTLKLSSNSDGSYRSCIKIYGCKIYENGELVRDYIPRIMHNAPCLYDRVNGTYTAFTDSKGGNPAALLEFGGDIWGEPPYIESDGTSGFNTLYHLKGGSSRVELDMRLTESSGTASWRMLGAYGSGEKHIAMNCYCCDDDRTGFGFHQITDGGDSLSKVISKTDLPHFRTAPHTIIVDLENSMAAIVTGSETNTIAFPSDSLGGIVADGALVLGGELRKTNDDSDVRYCAKMRIYGCRIYEDGVMVKNYIPAVRDDSVAGLMDLVSGDFATGVTPGAFSAGGKGLFVYDRNAPYVSTAANASDDGCLYFDTGYYVQAGTRVELDCERTENARVTYFVVDGSATNSNNRFLMAFRAYDTIFYSYATTEFKPIVPNGYDFQFKRRTYVLDNKNLVLSMTTGSYTNWVNSYDERVASSPSSPIYIAAMANSDHSFAAPIKIYGCRIYEDDELVRDFVPCINGGVPGLYDKATEAFITASGKGALEYGGSIAVVGDLTAVILDDYDKKLRQGETTTLTAYAPGAESYRWFRNGTEIEGETSNTLVVGWSDGGTPVNCGHTDSYTVKAAYRDLDGGTVESEASVPAAVKSVNSGFFILVM